MRIMIRVIALLDSSAVDVVTEDEGLEDCLSFETVFALLLLYYCCGC